MDDDPEARETGKRLRRNSDEAPGRKQDEIEAGDVPLPRTTPIPPPRTERPAEEHWHIHLGGEDALRNPIDLASVPPLKTGPPPRGLGSRLFRAILPFAIPGLLVAGIWLASRRADTVNPPPAPRPVVAAQAEPTENLDPVSDPRSGALGPGTVALNVVPWARVDAIYSVYDGHEIEPDGLVSPCTVSLPPGRYTFTVSHPDFGSVDLSLIVKSGQVTKVEHSLISDREMEKELAPVLKSAGYPAGRTSESAMSQSASLQR